MSGVEIGHSVALIRRSSQPPAFAEAAVPLRATCNCNEPGFQLVC